VVVVVMVVVMVAVVKVVARILCSNNYNRGATCSTDSYLPRANEVRKRQQFLHPGLVGAGGDDCRNGGGDSGGRIGGDGSSDGTDSGGDN
jgi:hypothetical protein